MMYILSLKNDVHVNVPSKSNKQKTFFNLVFWRLEGQGRKWQDPDSDPLVRGMDPRIQIHTNVMDPQLRLVTVL